MSADLDAPARRMFLASGVLSFILFGGGQAVVGAALPYYEARLNIDTQLSSWLVSSLGLGGLVGLVILFFLGHHVMPRMAIGIMAAGNALMAAAPGFAAAVLGGSLFGLGLAMTAAMFNTRVLASFGPSGPSRVSLLNAGYSVGAIVGPLVFLALGSNPMLLFGGNALLFVLVMLFTGPEGSRKAARPQAGKGFHLHVPILAFGMISVAIEVSLIGLGPTALIRAGQSPEAAARLLSMFFLAFLAGRVVLTFLADRLPSFAIYLAGMLMTCVFGTAAALIDPAVFYVPLGFSAGLFFPGFFMTAIAKMGDDVRVAPVVLGVTQVGVFGGPLIVAALLPGLGERGFFWMIAGVAAVMAGLALASYRRMSA